jgi:tRNA(fMet)-specific endonuclease VapC
MEIICLDTSVLIEFYRNKDKSTSFWFQLAKNYQFSIPAIVKYEVLRGDKKKDEFWLEIFNHISILPFDSDCADYASEIYKRLKLNNQLVATDDLLIAATAMKNNLKIATLNADHFKRIEEIVVLTPDT